MADAVLCAPKNDSSRLIFCFRHYPVSATIHCQCLSPPEHRKTPLMICCLFVNERRGKVQDQSRQRTESNNREEESAVIAAVCGNEIGVGYDTLHN